MSNVGQTKCRSIRTPLPVSAQAKQLALAATPSLDFIHTAIIRPFSLLARGELTYLLTDVALPALLLALRAAWLVGTLTTLSAAVLYEITLSASLLESSRANR